MPSWTSRPKRKVGPPGVNRNCPTASQFAAGTAHIPRTKISTGSPAVTVCVDQGDITGREVSRIRTSPMPRAIWDMWLARLRTQQAERTAFSHLDSWPDWKPSRYSARTNTDVQMSGINWDVNQGNPVPSVRQT